MRYSIKEKNGYQYVQADRQVLTGDDPTEWEKQIENYINKAIRNNKDIILPTTDGHFLILTERSAYKLSDRHVSKITKEVEALLSNEQYFLKGKVATHIDELIKIARFSNGNPDIDNKHENDIGEDGFNYYNAYFKDFDGVYYKVRFSSAINGQDETVYSIGVVRKRRLPDRVGSSSNYEALKNGRKSSNTIIYTTDNKSQEEKTTFQLAFEKALKKKAESNAPDGRKSKDDTIDADYLSAVERGDTETAQRMVDEAAERAFANSKIRGEDGKLLKVYHGSDADFTVFDKTKGRANMDIQGMFFSPWELDASGYGQNVRAFYLNVTNPANESTGYKALNRHMKENNAGVKAREEVQLMPKLLLLICSLVMYYAFLFGTGVYAKYRCRLNAKFFIFVAGCTAAFIVLMLLFSQNMYVNIAVTVAYVFSMFAVIYRFGKTMDVTL